MARCKTASCRAYGRDLKPEDVEYFEAAELWVCKLCGLGIDGTPPTEGDATSGEAHAEAAAAPMVADPKPAESVAPQPKVTTSDPTRGLDWLLADFTATPPRTPDRESSKPAAAATVPEASAPALAPQPTPVEPPVAPAQPPKEAPTGAPPAPAAPPTAAERPESASAKKTSGAGRGSVKVPVPSVPPGPVEPVEENELLGATAFPEIVLFQGGKERARYLLCGDEFLIGRVNDRYSPPLDFTQFTSGTAVSRNHARIYQQGGVYWVEDLGSANGTWVNGKPLGHHMPRELHDEDRISIAGVADLVFLLPL